MLISQKKETKQIVLNSLVELGDDISTEKQGKGRQFTSRFIEAGIAHYSDFGDVLITKETLNKFIHTMVGCPLIINHKPINDKNADKERVGVISDVWYNEADGWFYCKGIIWDKQAIDLVKNQGWNVSCTYDFVSDNQPKTHNGKKIDLEFIDGNFQHLALVENPRYERANIVINSKDLAENWNESKHPRDEKGQFAEVFEEVGKKYKTSKETTEKKQQTTIKREIGTDPARIDFEIKQAKDLSDYIYAVKTNTIDKIEKIKKENPEEAKWEAEDKLEYIESRYKEYAKYMEDHNKKMTDEVIKKLKGYINNGWITTDGINEEDKELKETKNNKVQNGKDNAIMAVMDDLKNFILSVVNNEDDKEKKEKVENEDKRKLIDEVGGILKGKVDEEVWRTVIGKLEKIAYNPSETDKADNKCKNEDDEEKDEKEEKYEEMKEIANKKAKNEEEKDKDKEDKKEVNNSMDRVKEMIIGGNSKTELKSSYVSQDERLKLGDNY